MELESVPNLSDCFVSISRQPPNTTVIRTTSAGWWWSYRQKAVFRSNPWAIPDPPWPACHRWPPTRLLRTPWLPTPWTIWPPWLLWHQWHPWLQWRPWPPLPRWLLCLRWPHWGHSPQSQWQPMLPRCPESPPCQPSQQTDAASETISPILILFFWDWVQLVRGQFLLSKHWRTRL